MLPIRPVLSAQILLFHLAPSALTTPLQLYPPTLLDSVLVKPTTLPIINTTSLNENPCLDPGPPRHFARYRDCETAIAEMNKGKITQMYTFGRGDGVTYRLPKTFVNGTCVVSLDMVYHDDEDYLSFRAIKDVAYALALRCTAGTFFNVGGVVPVGPRNVLYVTMLGTVTEGTS